MDDVIFSYHGRPVGRNRQGVYNSGKPGNLREFVNSGKLSENSGNLKFTQGIYQMLAIFFVTQSETHKKMT